MFHESPAATAIHETSWLKRIAPMIHSEYRFPIFFLSRRQLPQWFSEWLDLIPVAILSALVFPELVTVGNPRHLDFSQPQLWVALPTFLFALKTKSLGGTVVVGMMLFWIVGKLL
jgi:branched-subunit amino acid transport protein